MATIQGVYVALFGRPADPAGLAYFNGITNNGADLAKIGVLSGQKEYTTRFDGQNNVQIINSIYQSLFGRDAEAAGLEFFSNALTKGTLSINNIAIAILDGAQGADKTVVATKIAAADAYTKAIDTAIEIGSYSGTAAATTARDFLKTITTTAPTQAQIDASVKAIVDNSNTGNTLTAAIATAENYVVGTVATGTTDKNDTINATVTGTAGTNTNAADAWLFSADKADGGFGTDTFNVGIDAAVAVIADGLKNIEIINVAAAANASIDVTEAKQATQVWNNASGASTLDVTGLALTTTAGVKGAVTGATSFAFADATGSSDTASLAIDAKVGASTVTIDLIETLNLSNTGTSNANVTTLDLGATKALNVSGSGNLALATSGDVLETVNASTFTGNLSINLAAETKLVSFTGGAGDDAVTIDTLGLTKNVTISGGAGADVLTVANNAGAASAFTITLTGGASADQFVFGGAAALDNVQAVDTAANLAKSLITITDFTKAEDVITFTTVTKDALSTVELADIANEADLLAAAVKAASYTTATNVSAFIYGGDAYFLVNNGAAAFGADDGLVKVTGVTNLADFTTSNYTVV